jgi:hypothetical protein
MKHTTHAIPEGIYHAGTHALSLRPEILHLQLKRQLEDIHFVAYHAGRIVQAFGIQVAMLIICRDARIEPIYDVVHSALDFLAVAAVIRLDAGESAIRLELSDPYFGRNQVKAGDSP